MRTLYVAAGGGGDAVGALLARRALGDTDERPPLVTTCAWERLRIDPVPGPRTRNDFTGLGLIGGEPCEVLPSSDTVPAARSVLPRLAETSGARIFLHDFEAGALGLTGQIQRLAGSLDVDRLLVVDVGGDIVARGPEPTLKSPLADALTLAAALSTDIPTTVAVLGPGSDAELPEIEVLKLLERVGGKQAGRVSPDDVKLLSAVLSWHPTEASALVAGAAEGVRGPVAMRRGHEPVPITRRTPTIWLIADPTFDRFPLAEKLHKTASLAEAESAMRAFAVNEIDYEREVSSLRRLPRSEATLSRLILEMRSTEASYITTRRLTEILGQKEALELASRLPEHGAGLWSIDDLARIGRIQDADDSYQ